MTKILVLTFFILLRKDLAISKLMQEWNFLFIKKKNIFIVFDLVLLSVNLARHS